MIASTERVNGRTYRIRRTGRTWVAGEWCNCIIGPHWHEQATAPTRHALIAYLLRMQPDDPR